MSTPSLYLTADERTMFDTLSESLRDGWQVVDETSNAHERPEELKMRVLMLDQQDPELKTFVQALQSAGAPKSMAELADKMEHVSPSVFYTLFFTIGTKAMSAMIAAFLSAVRSDEDLAGIAFLTGIRHELFQSNAEVSPA